MATEEEVKTIWRCCDCVCFDVDSTIIQHEGLDDFAEFCGVGEQIAKLTSEAMSGGLPFREALMKRLNIINPTLKQLNDFITSYPPRLSPGISQLIHLLYAMNRPVFLVSGGFLPIINPVASLLNIPLSNVFANDLTFDCDGNYSGFDTTQPTSETGGKIKVAQILKNKYGFQNLVFIGDGITDLETVPPADAFIGYGGNRIRAAVQRQAKWFVTDFDELTEELQ